MYVSVWIQTIYVKILKKLCEVKSPMAVDYHRTVALL